MPFPLISGLAISTFAALVPEVGIDIAPPFPDAPAAAFGKTCPLDSPNCTTIGQNPRTDIGKRFGFKWLRSLKSTTFLLFPAV